MIRCTLFAVVLDCVSILRAFFFDWSARVDLEPQLFPQRLDYFWQFFNSLQNLITWHCACFIYLLNVDGVNRIFGAVQPSFLSTCSSHRMEATCLTNVRCFVLFKSLILRSFKRSFVFFSASSFQAFAIYCCQLLLSSMHWEITNHRCCALNLAGIEIEADDRSFLRTFHLIRSITLLHKHERSGFLLCRVASQMFADLLWFNFDRDPHKHAWHAYKPPPTTSFFTSFVTTVISLEKHVCVQR